MCHFYHTSKDIRKSDHGFDNYPSPAFDHFCILFFFCSPISEIYNGKQSHPYLSNKIL
ncbi:hypothetical protein BVRB_1g005310 [Beta vulgaris subsp. vulgaris]|nr:hypothetical protein BVRB_1g005310 [Beta vulgaris subsp. vulgaris]